MLTVKTYLHNLQTNFLQWHYRRTVGRGIAKQLKMREVSFPMEIKILVTKQTKKRKPKPTKQSNPPTKNTTSISFESNHSLITHKDHGSFFSLTMHFHCCFLHAKSMHISKYICDGSTYMKWATHCLPSILS